MSKQKPPKDPTKNEPKKQPAGDYKVGYAKPPEQHRWKKGQPSPNPSGRPKGRKSIESYIFEELGRQIAVASASGHIQMEIREATAKKYVEKLLKNADLKHFRDAFRIDAEQGQLRQSLVEAVENPIHQLHRQLALTLFAHADKLSEEEVDKFLYPDGKCPY